MSIFSIIRGLSLEAIATVHNSIKVITSQTSTIDEKLDAGLDAFEVVARETPNAVDDMAVATLRSIQGTAVWQWVIGFLRDKVDADPSEPIAVGAFGDACQVSCEQALESARNSADPPPSDLNPIAIVSAAIALLRIIRAIRNG